MAIDWGAKAATSGATGLAEAQRQTAQGRAAERERLRAMARYYRDRGDDREARSYERQAEAIPA